MNEPLVIIAGPTAVGKTALSIALAKKLNGEIISGDSMQVYRGMDIGTAKITPAETDFSGRSSAVLGRGRKVRTPQGAVGGNASPP